MKPLIGVTASLLQELPNRDWILNSHDYFRAVQRAGGIPVLLPFVETEGEAAEVLDRVDGLLLSGGGDADPHLYGEQPHPQMGEIQPERDIAELAYTKRAMARTMPILGICRGHQMLAIVAGGSLVQDIPSQIDAAIKHRQEAPRWYPSHTVTAKDGTRLASLLGTEFKVNTYHHQSVKELPSEWVVSAVAADGVIEALEHPGYPFLLGVQWHPENFQGRPYNFDRLFVAFVEACRGQQKL